MSNTYIFILCVRACVWACGWWAGLNGSKTNTLRQHVALEQITKSLWLYEGQCYKSCGLLLEGKNGWSRKNQFVGVYLQKKR